MSWQRSQLKAMGYQLFADTLTHTAGEIPSSELIYWHVVTKT